MNTLEQQQRQFEHQYIHQVQNYLNPLFHPVGSVPLTYYNQALEHIVTDNEVKSFNRTHNVKTYNYKTPLHNNDKKPVNPRPYNNTIYNCYENLNSVSAEQQSIQLSFENMQDRTLRTDGTIFIYSPFVPVVGDLFISESNFTKFIYEVTQFETMPHTIENVHVHKLSYRLAEVGNISEFIKSLRIFKHYFYSSFFNCHLDLSKKEVHNKLLKNLRNAEHYINNNEPELSKFLQRKTSVYNLTYSQDTPNTKNTTNSVDKGDIINQILSTDKGNTELVKDVSLKDFLLMELQANRGNP